MYFYVFGGMLIGAIVGGMTARRRGGRPLDIAQYAAAYGIMFALVGLAIRVAISRIFVG